MGSFRLVGFLGRQNGTVERKRYPAREDSHEAFSRMDSIGLKKSLANVDRSEGETKISSDTGHDSYC